MATRADDRAYKVKRITLILILTNSRRSLRGKLSPSFHRIRIAGASMNFLWASSRCYVNKQRESTRRTRGNHFARWTAEINRPIFCGRDQTGVVVFFSNAYVAHKASFLAPRVHGKKATSSPCDQNINLIDGKGGVLWRFRYIFCRASRCVYKISWIGIFISAISSLSTVSM